jgi:hypothetical protein
MNLIIRSMPGLERKIAEYRLLFSQNPGERPIELPRIQGGEQLREFLADQLGQPSATITRVFADLEASHGATTYIANVPLDSREINAILRAMEAEQAEAEAHPVEMEK